MDRRNFLKLTATGIAGAAIAPILRTPAWAQTAATAGRAATTLKAAGTWGHGIGIGATAVMLSNFLYVLRKRWSL